MQPSYGATTGFFQNGVQQQHWQESNTIPSNFAEQPQPSQQLYGQQPQQPYAQQLYGQQGQWTQGYGQPVQNMQAYSQQSAQPLYGQQGAATQAAYVQQMPGQQVVHAPAAVVGAQYCAQAEQIFFINEKWASLSRDDFSILDRTQQPVFKMDSSAFSVTQKRVLKTAKGQAVCSLKKKLLSKSCPTWFLSLGASASDKERIAVIKKDTFNGAHSASIFLSSNTTQFFSQPVCDYQARGDVKNRSFFIYRGSMPVAEIMRSLSTAEKVTGANHYVLRVSHGTDYALMIAFCVVIDELFND